MAYFRKIFIALLVVIAATTLAYGQLLGGLLGSQVAQIDVLGRLVCTATGNVLSGYPSPGIAGVDVNVYCNGGQLSLGTLTTNATGFFDGVLKTAEGILFDPSTCVVKVKLPILSCNLLPPTGILQAALSVGGLLNTLLGLLAYLLTGAWQIIAL